MTILPFSVQIILSITHTALMTWVVRLNPLDYWLQNSVSFVHAPAGCRWCRVLSVTIREQAAVLNKVTVICPQINVSHTAHRWSHRLVIALYRPLCHWFDIHRTAVRLGEPPLRSSSSTQSGAGTRTPATIHTYGDTCRRTRTSRNSNGLDAN
jgi:hypothetical protein